METDYIYIITPLIIIMVFCELSCLRLKDIKDILEDIKKLLKDKNQ